MKCLWDGCNSNDLDDLKEHIMQHAKGTQDYICRWETCQRRNELMNKYSFAAHLRIHTGEKPYKCSKCEKDFARADALSKHYKRHEVEDKLIQTQVDKIFYQSENRDLENQYTKKLLKDRQVEIDCYRLILDEISYQIENKEDEDSWLDY